MPRIPIPQQPPLALIDGGARTDGGSAPLPPETAAGLRTLAARTARIDRELAVSQSWLSGHERLARAEDAPQGPPSGFLRSFLEEADRERETALKTPLPDDAKGALGLDLLDLRATFADRAAEAEADGLALRRRLSLHETLEGYRTGVARDPGLYDRAADRMTALVADLGLPEDRRADLTRHATDRLANAAVDGLMGDPERAERLLSEGLFDDALSEGSKALRLKEARDLSSRQRLLARESRVADLAAQASDGALTEDAITAAERDGALGPAEAARLRETDRAAVEEAARKDARIERVAQAPDPFDPQDAEHRAAVSAYWDSVSEVHGSDDPEALRRTELAFVDRTGVLPEALRKRYQGELLSADAAVAVTGAETLSTLAAKDPALVADVPPGQVRKATIVAGFAELGLPPERAIDLADAEMDRDDDPPDPEIPAIRIAANQNGDDALLPDEDASGRQPDGSAVIVDPETGDRTTVPPDTVARFDALVAEHQALADLRADYLDLYDRVAAGEISREEATRLLLVRAAETLPVTNEAGSPIAANRSLRQAFERLATDIFDAADRDEAGTILADVLVPPDHARDIAELILSFLPVTGEIISAKDAYDGFRAAMAAMEDGRTWDALVDASLAGVSALEVIPLFGRAVKLGRGGVKIAARLSQVVGRAPGPKRKRTTSKNRSQSGAGKKRQEPSTDKLKGADKYKGQIVDDTGAPFSWYRKGRYTTNRTLKKRWEVHYGQTWPIDPDTGRDMVVSHEIALADGGTDHVSNIKPRKLADHIKLHKERNDFARWARRGKKQ